MAINPNLDPSEFYLGGGPVGVMLIHGFTGSPPEMRLIADYLNQRGLTVSGPLLPGHGTSIEDLNKRKWQEWTQYLGKEFSKLKRNAGLFSRVAYHWDLSYPCIWQLTTMRWMVFWRTLPRSR